MIHSESIRAKSLQLELLETNHVCPLLVAVLPRYRTIRASWSQLLNSRGVSSGWNFKYCKKLERDDGRHLRAQT